MHSRLSVLAFLAILALVAGPARAQFTPSVALPGDLAIGPAAGTQEKPAIAFGGSHSLVVWEESKSALGGFVSPPDGIHPNRDVYGVILDANGAPTSTSPIVIQQGPWDQLEVRVAWNGSNYLVVWESTRPTQFYRTQGVYAARVTPQGAVLDDPPIVIDDEDDFDERWPVVTSDGSNWMVAWTDRSGATGQCLSGALVDPTGLVLTKKVLVPGTSPLPTNYEARHAGNRYAVVFEKNFSGGIAARLYDGALVQVGAEVAASSGNRPAIASSGSSFYVCWLSGGVRGSLLTTAGALAFPGGAPLSTGATLGDARVEAGWDGGEFTVVYNGSNEVYASQVDAAGNLIAGGAFVLSSGLPWVSDPVVGDGLGRATAVWTDWRNTSGSNPDPFDLYAVQVLPGQSASSAYPIAVSPPSQVFPAIAGDASSGYLVAYLSKLSGQTQVLAQRLSPLGIVLDAQPIVLATDAPVLGPVDVAWDGAEWMVVWHRFMGGSSPSYLYHSFFRRVRADGSLPDAGPVDLLNGESCKVAAVGGTFLVSAHWHYPPVQSNEIYHFKRVDGASGSVLDPLEVLIAGGSGTSDLVGFDDRWLFVWGGVTGAFIQSSGAVGALFLAANSGSSGEARPNLARNGDEVLLSFVTNGSLTWNADLRARRIRKDGTLLDLATGSFVSSAPNGQLQPAAAWLGDKYLVAFTDFRDHPDIEPGIGDVYGVRVSATNQILDAPELPVQNRWPTAEGRAAVAGGNQRALVITSVLDPAPTFGCWRLHLQQNLGTSGTAYCAGDGSAGAPCPCANLGAFGRGCDNSAATGGAQLSASGFTVPDSLVLTATGELPTSLSIFLQGSQDTLTPLAFGDGLRCVGGVLKRLYVRAASAGIVAAPAPGEPGIQAQSAALGDGIAPGSTRGYQVYYRDANAAFCPPPQGNNWNVTNALRIQW